MKTKLLFLGYALSLCTIFQVKAQHRVYLGAQFGLGVEYQSKTDPNNLILSTKRFGHSTYGSTLRYELDDKYGFEIGLLKEPLMKTVRIRDVDFDVKFEAGSPTISYIRIPLRLNMRVWNINDKMTFYVSGGASHLRYMFESGQLHSEWSGDFDQDAQSYRKDFYVLDKYNWMLEGGTSLTYKLTSKFNLDASMNYMGGFEDLTRTDVKYKRQNGPEQQATVISRGDKLSFNIGLRYRVLELKRLND